MKKRYYIRRWKKLDRLYDEFHRINELLKDDEDNVELLYRRSYILKRIKDFLRYEKDKHKSYND